MDEVDPIKQREADARELRRAILARLDQFRDLQAAATYHATAQPGHLENTIQLETTRAELLMDIRRLSALLLELGKKIDDKRWMKWLLPPCLGMIGYFLYLQLYKLPYFRRFSPTSRVNEHGERRPLFLTLLALLPWITRPLAAYKIYLYEKQRSQTARLQEGVEELESQVQTDSPLQNTKCLEASKWDRIPWDECKDMYDRALLYMSMGL